MWVGLIQSADGLTSKTEGNPAGRQQLELLPKNLQPAFPALPSQPPQSVSQFLGTHFFICGHILLVLCPCYGPD